MIKEMTYEDLINFRFDLSLQLINNEETTKAVKKYNYNGDFQHILHDDNTNTQKEYIFVCTNYYKKDDEDMMVLAPIKMQDDEIMQTYEQEEYKRSNFKYRMWDSNRFQYQIHHNELIDFDGFVSKISPHHQYVTINNINYRICENIEKENENIKGFKETFSNLQEMGVDVDIMKKDNYMGSYDVPIVYANGERTIERYNVTQVDGEFAYFEPYDVPLRNTMNVPHYSEEYDCMVWQNGFPSYVPYTCEVL